MIYIVFLAALAVIGLSYVPELQLIVYPFTLLSTMAHEGSHAVAAWLTGGSVHSIEVNRNGSGMVTTTGGWGPVINSAGYVGTTLVGATITVLATLGNSRHLLRALSIISLAIGVGCLFSLSIVGTVISLIWTTVFHAAVGIRSEKTSTLLVLFVGMNVMLDSYRSLIDLWRLTGTGILTDAVNMSNSTGVPQIVWVVAWMLFSTVITYHTVKIALNR